MKPKEFDNDKKQHIYKLKHVDKSKKGSIDKPVVELIKAINSMKDYYTTSSCSGRMMEFLLPESWKKHEVKWLFVSHHGTDAQTEKKLLSEIKTLSKVKETVYFRYEPLILHLVARDIESAKKIINIANKVGFKHSGIISMANRIIVEIIGTDRLDVPIAADKKVLVTEDYFKFLLIEANKKHKRNIKRINDFVKAIKI